MKGYRKLILAISVVVLGIILILINKFTSEVSEFLKWIYALFAGSNILEHTIERYERRKKDIENTINRSSPDDVKRKLENAIKDNR